MSNLLTFLRPIPLSGVQRVLIVQTGSGSRLPRLVERSRGLFGEARVEGGWVFLNLPSDLTFFVEQCFGCSHILKFFSSFFL